MDVIQRMHASARVMRENASECKRLNIPIAICLCAATGFVVKSALLSAPSRPSPQFPSLPPMAAGQRIKLFLNLCSDAAIALPSMQQDAEGNEQLRVPVSAGPVTLGVDKDGVTPVLVTDMVLNPASVSRASTEKDFRAFIAGFTLQKVQEKYHCVVDLGEQSIKFPKMRYKGPLPPPSQHIRRPAGAHIEPEAPLGRGQTEEQNRAYEDAMEERRKAAQLARIEALRAMEERESGIIMSGGKAAATAAAKAASSTPIFTSAEAAKAAEEADSAKSPVDRMMAASSKESAKIEVISEEPAAAAPAAAAARQRSAQPQPAKSASSAAESSMAASSSAAAPASSSTATVAAAAPAASAAPVDPRLPSHVISYLKSNGSSVPASEWDLDLTSASPAAASAGPTDEDDEDSLLLPAAVQVLISLPLAGSAQEIDVDITKAGVDLASKPGQDKHQYRLHVSVHSIAPAAGLGLCRNLESMESLC